jgi:hypothetical protein
LPFLIFVVKVLIVTKLILRVGALSTEKDDIPRNVYNPAKPILPEAILDKKSYLAERFLITKYACHQQMFGSLDKSYTFCFLLLIFGQSFSLNC